MLHLRLTGAVLASSLLLAPVARAQDGNPGWFVPQSHAPAGTAAPPAKPQPRPAPAPVRREPVPVPMPMESQAAQDEAPLPAVSLPPVPDLPQLPKVGGSVAVHIGVLSVPDVMRNAKAAQAVEKTIAERREKLNADAQKELASEREMGQAYVNERGKLSAEQQRTREHDMQERVMNAQKQFRERNQVIQGAAQYALAQIERTLIAVVRQVSESREMNLVLHRSQVALNFQELDITEQVTAQLNNILPAVNVPPEGVTVPQWVAQQGDKAAASPNMDAATKPPAPPAAAQKPAAKP